MTSKLKNIELSAKKIIRLILESGSAPEVIDSPQNIFTESLVSKILVLRQDRIGDVLVSIPFFRALRQKFPLAQIDVVLSQKNIGAVKAIEPYINHFWTYTKRVKEVSHLMGDIRHEQYDLVIDMFDNESATSSAFVRYSGAKYSLGLQKDNQNVYSHVVPLKSKHKHHIVERIANLLLPFGIDPLETDLTLRYNIDESDLSRINEFVSLGHNKIRVGVNLAGSNRNKFWGTENYISLINKIEDDPTFEVIIFASSEYNKEADEIIAATSSSRAPQTESSHEYALQLSTCDLIISPDTAALHYAAAFGKPCIAFYNTQSKLIKGLPWYPYGVPHKSYEADSGNISDISPDTAYQGFLELKEIMHENLNSEGFKS